MKRAVMGPVAITGAGGHVGRALQERLEDVPNEVRPLGRDDDLAAAFADAEVVVHLAGTLQAVHGNSYHEANVGTVRRTMRALAESLVRRILFLSYVGADPTSPNEYLASKGQAEEIVRGGPVESIVIRSTFIYGPPHDPGPSATPFLTDGGSVSVIGTGQQRWAPVYVGDVVEALTRAALDRSVPTGTFALAGPQELTVDEFVDALNRRHVRERHLAGRVARVISRLSSALTPTMVEVLEADSLPDGRLISDVLGLELHRVADVYH